MGTPGSAAGLPITKAGPSPPRSRHVGGVAMECDYAGHTIPIIDPSTGEIRAAQIYVAVLSASQLTFSYASFSQKLPDWIEANQRAFSYFGGVTKTTICDNLKSAVAKALWFEPTLNATFAAFADHYDTTILPARPRRPRDKPSAEGSVLIIERWVLARLRNDCFFSLVDLNIRISALIEDLNTRTMRRYGKSRRALFDEVERDQLKPLPSTPFEYAEWKVAKVHPDYHVEVDKTFYSVPHALIGRRVDIRLTYRAVEIFFDHKRVASHIRSSQRSGHITVNEHMPKAHQRYANTTPHTLRREAAKVGTNTAIFIDIERLLCDRPHPEQGYRSAQGRSFPGASLPIRSAGTGLRASAGHQRTELFVCRQHSQIWSRSGSGHERGCEAGAAARQYSRQNLLPMKRTSDADTSNTGSDECAWSCRDGDRLWRAYRAGSWKRP